MGGVRGRHGRRLARLAAMAVAVLALPSPAGAQEPAHTRTTYAVPVTTPDELGSAVTIQTDVYLPTRPAPAGGFPLVMVFHGGGSNKDNGFDAGNAAYFADHGYAAVLYSQRGHGGSTGQTAVAGPKEMRDLFDVAAWALGRGGRTEPAHAPFPLDAQRIALAGYSQGGLHTNLGQVHSSDPALNPYGVRFRALLPGNTPDQVFKALVKDGTVKLSYGAGLLGTYTVAGDTKGRIAPAVARWIATAGADRPELYGRVLCEHTVHDTTTSAMKADLAFRSVGCFTSRMTPPSLWAQALDDELFTPDMAIRMWREMPAGPLNRLYLDMAGHAAPGADPSVQADKRRVQLAFLDHHLRGRSLEGPPIVYWTRDPDVRVPGDAYAYPPGAWRRHTARQWPPAGVVSRRYTLSADGRARRGGTITSGSFPLQPLTQDIANDPVAKAVLSSTPLGTSPVPSSVPSTFSPGFVASFATGAFDADHELSGLTIAQLGWTPTGAESQLVVQLYDQAPGGALTLLSRGLRGLRGETPGQRRSVNVSGTTFSARIRRDHRLLVVVLAGNASFFKPFAGSAGGVLEAGPASTIDIPLRRL